jgi:DNA polymerase III delta subunit
MEIIILQGENNLALKERLSKFVNEAKKRNWSIIRIEKEERVLDKILLSGLYDKGNLFIVEDYKSISKSDLKYLKEKMAKIDGVLVICSQGGNIPSSILKNFPKIKKIENFDYPKIVFQFLDSLYPSNSKNAILLFHQMLEREPEELIFHLISSRLKDLYWVKIDPSTLPYPSWQVEKLERQASRFTQDNLRQLIEELALLDIEAKRSSLGLIYYLDLLLVKHLK